MIVIPIYYHGGAPDLNPNSLNKKLREVLPPKSTGVRVYPKNRADRVYITTNIKIAEAYAAFHVTGKGRVYQVLPVGAFEPDPHWGCGSSCYQVERASILSIIELPQAHRTQLVKARQIPVGIGALVLH